MIELVQTLFIHFAAPCTPKSNFLGLPTWYKYLDGTTDATGRCAPEIHFLHDTNALAAIGLALADLLLVVAGIVAFGFVMYGGFRYLTSQGEPENTRVAQQTVINALIGLFIAILASAVVRFIGGQF